MCPNPVYIVPAANLSVGVELCTQDARPGLDGGSGTGPTKLIRLSRNWTTLGFPEGNVAIMTKAIAGQTLTRPASPKSSADLAASCRSQASFERGPGPKSSSHWRLPPLGFQPRGFRPFLPRPLPGLPTLAGAGLPSPAAGRFLRLPSPDCLSTWLWRCLVSDCTWSMRATTSSGNIDKSYDPLKVEESADSDARRMDGW